MLKRRFNWLDAVCILLVAALILGGVWYFTRAEEPEKESNEVPYVVTLRCAQTTDDPLNYMKAGDTLYFFNRTQEVGNITSVKLMDRLVEEYDEQKGEFIVLTDPTEQLIEIEVEVQGLLEKDTFRANGVKMHVGQVFYPETDLSRTIATVWSIEEVA